MTQYNQKSFTVAMPGDKGNWPFPDPDPSRRKEYPGNFERDRAADLAKLPPSAFSLVLEAEEVE